MTINRRSLITGLFSLVAAPAIVRVSSIMPVRSLPHEFEVLLYGMNTSEPFSAEYFHPNATGAQAVAEWFQRGLEDARRCASLPCTGPLNFGISGLTERHPR